MSSFTTSTLGQAVRCALRRRVCYGLQAGIAIAAVATSPGAQAQLFPAEFELSSLQLANGGDGSTGFVINGINDYDSSGNSVSAAGDVNGDGIDDLIVGAGNADPGGRDYAGESYVVFGTGAGFAAEFELSSLQLANGGNGSTGFVINGINDYDSSGKSVSAAGDVNGDGIDDLIVGAYNADPGGRNLAGESYVVFGTNTGFVAELELSSLLPANGGNGSAGFVLNGIDNGDFSGFPVSAAGDVNSDGIDDLIVGAGNADPGGRNYAGESYVVFGTGAGIAAEFELTSLLPANGGNGSNGFVLNGIDNSDFSGRSVSAAGDVNGDGIDDLIVGAGSADPGGRNAAGESYVVFGTNTGFAAEFELSSLLPANGGNGSTGFVLNGIDPLDASGRSVSAAGDVNGDGIDDLIVRAVGADPGDRSSAGESYVVFGTNTGFAAEFELSSLLSANGGDGSTGFVLNGIDNRDYSGYSVSAAGDVNGDGIDDLIVGAVGADPGGRSSAGESYVVFGTNTGFAAEFELSSLLPANGGNGSAGFVLNGINSNDYSGHSVSAAGDVNGDGTDDLIVGARNAAPGGRTSAGESYVVFGRRDADGDGHADFTDNCPATANADQADADNDGVGDACDNCPQVENDTQCDTNMDGFGNVCDADLNNDGIVNSFDLGILRSNFGAAGANDADLNCDLIVNTFDLTLMRELFGQPPSPSQRKPLRTATPD